MEIKKMTPSLPKPDFSNILSSPSISIDETPKVHQPGLVQQSEDSEEL